MPTSKPRSKNLLFNFFSTSPRKNATFAERKATIIVLAILRTHDQGSQQNIIPLHCQSSASSMKVTSNRIPFHITHRREEMVVVLDRKGFDPPLIHMPGPACFDMSMLTHRVHHRQPTEALTDLICGCQVAPRNANDPAWRQSRKLAVEQSAMFHPAPARSPSVLTAFQNSSVVQPLD